MAPVPTHGNAIPTVHVDQIPEFQRMELLSVLAEETAASFKNPDVQARYEKWCAERKAGKEVN